MQYTYFSKEQILASQDYKNICNLFLSLATNDSEREKLEFILYEGGYKDFGLVTKIGNKDNVVLERKRRISIANLLIKNPEAFDVLVADKINAFHGTNANSLSSILQNGLNSYAESKRQGINVITGEEWSRRYIERDYISFTDVFDVAEQYATLDSREGNEKLSFPVILGTSVTELRKSGICSVHSDVAEIGVKSKVPIENIKVILVPFDKVNFVRKMVGNKMKVFGIDYYDDKFYGLTDYGKIAIFEDKLDDYRNNRNNHKKFSMSEISRMASKRLISGIKNNLAKIKSMIKGGSVEYENGKNK